MSRKSVAFGVFVAAAVLAPSFAFAASGYVSGRTAMRAGPDDGYPTVAVVRKGEGVELHACLPDWSWCDVGFEGQRGWLRADRIMGESVSGRVPVARAGRDLGIDTTGYNLDQYWDTNYNGRFDRNRGHWQIYFQSHIRPSWSDSTDDRDHRDYGDRHGDNRD